MIYRIQQALKSNKLIVQSVCILMWVSLQSCFAQTILTTEDVTQIEAINKPNKKSSEKNIIIPLTDDVNLSGRLLTGNTDAGGVLVLHDCQHSAQDYQILYTSLSRQGFHILALDLRGYGASQTALYSEQKIRHDSSDIVSYQGSMAALMSFWADDILQAFQYLQKAMNNGQGISVISSACSTNQAIYLAQKVPLNSLVMLAPEMSTNDKEQYKNLIDKPIYLLTAKYPTQALLNAQELFEWNGDSQSTIQIFKGDTSSYRMLKSSSHLADSISIWLLSTFEPK